MVREILHIKTDNGLGEKDPSFKNITIVDYEFTAPRMGMPSLKASLDYSSPLDDEWSGREYVVIRGEKYYIRQPASSEKVNNNVLYTHSLEFRSERDVLANVYFYDVVTDWASTKDKPCSNSSTFKFFGYISEFADRMNCAFIKAGIADSILQKKTRLTLADKPNGDGYCVVVGAMSDYDASLSKEVAFEDTYLWDALTTAYETYEIPFEFHGKQIIFTSESRLIDHVFKYGQGNELLSIKRTNANAKIINRVTFKGSSENIPYYYPNETEYGHIELKESPDNKVLHLSDITVTNRSLMLAVARENTPITLGAVIPDRSGEAILTSLQYDNRGTWHELTDGEWVLAQSNASPDFTPRIKYKIPFTVTNKGIYECADIQGEIWLSFLSQPEHYANLLKGDSVSNFSLYCDGKATSLTFKDNVIKLGELEPKKNYELHFEVSILSEEARKYDWYCAIQTTAITYVQQEEETTYYWVCGDTKKLRLGDFGLSYNGELTEEAVGDSFYWIGSERLPFQTNLMPPIFTRATVQGVKQNGLKSGDERFYNAKNGTYKNPDDPNHIYNFPNPYIDGWPCEHIYVNEDIKPTIEGVTNASKQLFGEIAAVAFDTDDNDSLKLTEEGLESADYEHSFFYIKLHKFDGAYGFSLFDSATQTDAMTIQMRSGKCNGCKFQIQTAKFNSPNGGEYFRNPVQTIAPDGDIVAGNYDKKVIISNLQEWQQDSSTNEIWICVKKENETFGDVMPNREKNMLPEAGDLFNIININLPQGYIDAAEQRGEDEAIRFMYDNNEAKFTYEIGCSRVYFANNRDVLEQIDENAKVQILYNGKIIEQYVNTFTIKCTKDNPLPEIGMALADTLAVGDSFVQNVVDKAISLIANHITMPNNGGGGNMSQSQMDLRYLRKAVADAIYLSKERNDRSRYYIASDSGFEIGKYTAGAAGGIFHVDANTGQTYAEVDVLRARVKAIFESLEISEVNTIGGKLLITSGGSVTITFMYPIYTDGVLTGYKCYFKGRDDRNGTNSLFEVGDFIYSEQFNLSDSDTNATIARRYWRYVSEVNNEECYVVLSAADCEDGSDAPQNGDVICQLGNRTKKNRQNAIVISTADANSPNITLYSGINTYSLNNRDIIDLGVDPTNNTPYFKCYGNAFIGMRNGNAYISKQGDDVSFKGNISLTSTVGDEKTPLNKFLDAQATSVLAQYSNNGTDWHPTYVNGDVWMRTSSDNGATWTPAIRIAGINYSNNMLRDTESNHSIWNVNAKNANGTVNVRAWDAGSKIYLTSGNKATGVTVGGLSLTQFAMSYPLDSTLMSTNMNYTLSFKLRAQSAHISAYLVDNDGIRVSNISTIEYVGNNQGQLCVFALNTQSQTKLASKIVIDFGNSYEALASGNGIEIGDMKLENGDNSTPIWSPFPKGTNGTNGKDGADGTDGKDGAYSVMQWAKNNDPYTEPTSGWADKPETALAGEYVWMRTGRITPPSSDVVWSDPVRMTGDRGNDGQSVYLLDLTNEIGSVAANANGAVLSGTTYPTSTACVYKGAEKLDNSQVAYSIAQHDGLLTASINANGVITMSGMLNTVDSATITIQATVNGVILTTTMTVYKVKAGANGTNGTNGTNGKDGADGQDGADGEAAVMFDIVPTVDNITRNADGSLSATSVGCSVYKTTGASERTLSNEHTLSYQRLPDGAKGELNRTGGVSSTVAITSTTTAVIFELKNGSIILDRERIPVFDDASGIEIGGGNLLLNSDFKTGTYSTVGGIDYPDYWSMGRYCSWHNSRKNDLTGSNSVTISRSGATGNEWRGFYQISMMSDNSDSDNPKKDGISDKLYVESEKTYQLSAWVMSPSIDSIDVDAAMEIRWFNEDDVHISTVSKSIKPNDNYVWERFVLKTKVPKGAYACRVFFFVTRNGQISVSDVQFEKGMIVTDWKPSVWDNDQNLLDVGIDVKSREVLVTGRFRTRNRKGETTAIVDEDGMLTTNLIRANELQAEKVVCFDNDGNVQSSVNLYGEGEYTIFYPKSNQLKMLQLRVDETTNSVIQFYNQDGSIAWTLGASGQIQPPQNAYTLIPVNLYYGSDYNTPQALASNVTLYQISSTSEATFPYSDLISGSNMVINTYADLNGRYVHSNLSNPTQLFALANFVRNEGNGDNKYCGLSAILFNGGSSVSPDTSTQKRYRREVYTFDSDAKATKGFIIFDA